VRKEAEEQARKEAEEEQARQEAEEEQARKEAEEEQVRKEAEEQVRKEAEKLYNRPEMMQCKWGECVEALDKAIRDCTVRGVRKDDVYAELAKQLHASKKWNVDKAKVANACQRRRRWLAELDEHKITSTWSVSATKKNLWANRMGQKQFDKAVRMTDATPNLVQKRIHQHVSELDFTEKEH
jgi:hypothetical protein